VSTFSLDDVEDVLEARALVENHTAAKSFAHRCTLVPQVEEVHAAMVRSSREHDTAGFTANDRLFHELIVDAAQNRVLSAIYRTLRERQTLFTSVMMRGRADRMQADIEEHERLLETLRGDDEAAFCALFRKSPVKRIGRDRFVRNVLYAIGNSGEPALAAEAGRLLDDLSSLVRGAAVWALGKLLDAGRFAALRATRLRSETEAGVIAEWAA